MSLVLTATGINKSFDRRQLGRGPLERAAQRKGQESSNTRKILSGFDFELNLGEIIFVEGANGSGKTTVLRILAGLLAPDSGIVTCSRRRIPLMSAGSLMHPELSILDNVRHSLLYLGVSSVSDYVIEEILSEAELSDYRSESPRVLSKGMLCRLMLLIGLNAGGEIFFIDELLDELDATWRERVWAKIWQLKETGVSFAISSHRRDDLKADIRVKSIKLARH